MSKNWLQNFNLDCPYSGIIVPSNFWESGELFPIFKFDNLIKYHDPNNGMNTFIVNIDEFRHPIRDLRNCRMIIMNFDKMSFSTIQDCPFLIWDYIFEINIEAESVTDCSISQHSKVEIGGPVIPWRESVYEIVKCLAVISEDPRGYEHFYACSPWSASHAIRAFEKWQGNFYQEKPYSFTPMKVLNAADALAYQTPSETKKNVAEIKRRLAAIIDYSDDFTISLIRGSMEMPKMIEEIIFQEPATIVKWSDGTKTVVKCKEGETFEKEVGLAMAIAKKYFGDDGHHGRARFKKAVEKAKVIPVKE